MYEVSRWRWLCLYSYVSDTVRSVLYVPAKWLSLQAVQKSVKWKIMGEHEQAPVYLRSSCKSMLWLINRCIFIYNALCCWNLLTHCCIRIYPSSSKTCLFFLPLPRHHFPPFPSQCKFILKIYTKRKQKLIVCPTYGWLLKQLDTDLSCMCFDRAKMLPLDPLNMY